MIIENDDDDPCTLSSPHYTESTHSVACRCDAKSDVIQKTSWSSRDSRHYQTHTSRSDDTGNKVMIERERQRKRAGDRERERKTEAVAPWPFLGSSCRGGNTVGNAHFPPDFYGRPFRGRPAGEVTSRREASLSIGWRDEAGGRRHFDCIRDVRRELTARGSRSLTVEYAHTENKDKWSVCLRAWSRMCLCVCVCVFIKKNNVINRRTNKLQMLSMTKTIITIIKKNSYFS